MYDINSKEIKAKYPKVGLILEKDNEKYKNSDKVEIIKSLNGEDIVCVWQNNFCYALNSKYNAKKAAKEWAEFYATKDFEDVFLVYGLANGMYVQALLEIISDTANVLIYEPDAEIFYRIMNDIDCHQILRDKRVMVAGGNEQLAVVVEWLNKHISYMNYKKVHLCPLPNYLQLYGNEWNQFTQLAIHQVEIVDSSVYTELKFGKEFQENILHNIGDSIFQSTINQLKAKFSQCNLKQIPVIIVSAGPSLDKNIKDLKKAEGKAFIIVVDTALKSVLEHGIIPDLAITVDSHKPEILFEHEKISKLPFLYCKYSNWKLNDKLKGRRFYSGHGEDFIGALHNSFKGEQIDNIESGGSVAHEGFSLAVYLGFQKIILVGQDLAYPDGKRHTRTAYQGKEGDIQKNPNLLWVEDVYGNQVLTEPNMDMYRKWFEKQIARYQSQIIVIDATEGGAKIAGAKIMSLCKAIEKECNCSCDFKTLIEEIPPVYTLQEREKIVAYFQNLPSILNKMEIEIQIGIEEYRELQEFNKKKMQGDEEYRKLIHKIGLRNKWIESQGEMELVSMYNKKEEYQIQENVYQQVEEKIEDEIDKIASDGIFMLESYIKGIHQLLEQWDSCLAEVKKREKETAV